MAQLTTVPASYPTEPEDRTDVAAHSLGLTPQTHVVAMDRSVGDGLMGMRNLVLEHTASWNGRRGKHANRGATGFERLGKRWSAWKGGLSHMKMIADEWVA